MWGSVGLGVGKGLWVRGGVQRGRTCRWSSVGGGYVEGRRGCLDVGRGENVCGEEHRPPGRGRKRGLREEGAGRAEETQSPRYAGPPLRARRTRGGKGPPSPRGENRGLAIPGGEATPGGGSTRTNYEDPSSPDQGRLGVRSGRGPFSPPLTSR